MTSNAVELRHIVKRFGPVVAVHQMDLEIADSSFLTFLGPSGCGKTTTLRMIAGLEQPSEGDILIKDRRINDLPIHRRNLGLVFQNYALFPHKSVFDNVAFGLKYRQVSRDEVRRRVREALDLVRLPQMADRYPSQLSGGQQQRIALARAVVIQPDVLLLDEPLSALDANLREEMRVELKRIQDRLGVTTIFVTHDQSEALAMSDRIVVMSAGHVEQIGTPEEVYNRPVSSFVAGFLGHANLLDGRIAGSDGDRVRVKLDDGLELVADGSEARGRSEGDPVRLVVRAEKLTLAGRHERSADHAVFPATVETVDYQGQAARYFIRAGELSLQAINPIDRHPFSEGAAVEVAVRPYDCVLLDAAS
ncbi:MAG: ABC transporter ATP-binding protein [Candidatus Competibacterales bacterium]|nr:ABC transporter ATP-binding protein [Candidatus Competibacterales bacterium]